jgi:hypothetical protein
MRFLATETFVQWIEKHKPTINQVAIVGGSTKDPEVTALRSFYPNIKFVVFGLENYNHDQQFVQLDLNCDTYIEDDKFDLVLCSQVLEHVWNHKNTFDVLKSLTSSGGLLWVNCPASNIPHGSPEYYSAGFSSGYLAKNLSTLGFHVLLAHDLGSKRYYFMTHTLKLWATSDEHRHPITKYHFQPGSFLGISRKYLTEIPGRYLSIFYSPAPLDSIDYATESLVLAKL